MRVALRTLTLKAKLKFGKHFESTCEYLIQNNKGGYLAWAYYNMSNISFDKAVLDRIGIEHEIQKPGKDVAYWEENRESIYANTYIPLTEKEVLARYHANQRIKKDKKMVADRNERYAEKSVLTRYNHGH